MERRGKRRIKGGYEKERKDGRLGFVFIHKAKGWRIRIQDWRERDGEKAEGASERCIQVPISAMLCKAGFHCPPPPPPPP